MDKKLDRQSGSRSMRPFLTIWTGQAFSLLGTAVVQFALVWWLTETSGSATVLALATMMAVLPQVIVGPFAGALVDRWSRRTVMIVADSVIALAVVALAALFALGKVHVWHIYLLIFMRAIGGAFHWPAMQASTTLMVPEKHLARIAGLNQALYGFSGIVAPLLGALLLAVLPMQRILAVDVGTAALAILPLLFIAVPQPERAPTTDSTPQASVIGDVREGLRFIRGWRGLTLVLGMSMLINLMIHPVMALQPLLVTGHFDGGAWELAALQSAMGIGMMAGGITLGVWGGLKRRTTTALLALVLSGIGFAVVGLTPSGAFPLALAALLFAFFMIPMVDGSLFAVLQVAVPAEMQGRVFTLLLSGGRAMAPLGLAVAGPLADRVGVQAWFLAVGIVMGTMGVIGALTPSVARLEDDAKGKAEPTAVVDGATAVVACAD